MSVNSTSYDLYGTPNPGLRYPRIVNITDVQIYPTTEDKLKAYAVITIDGCFVVRDIKIIEGHTGLFVAMPAKKKKDGTYKDVAHPLNQETREFIEQKILGAYHEKMSG